MRLSRALPAAVSIMASFAFSDAALASWTFTQGSGKTMFSLDSATTPAGSGNCAANECNTQIPIDSTGSLFGVAANPVYMTQLQGVGALAAVPAATTNGTALGTQPSNATRARLYIPPGDSVTFTIQATAPGSPPANVVTLTNSGTYMTNWDEYLTSSQMIYVTAMTGSCLFRWI